MDMMYALHKGQINSRRWYIYIHFVTFALVNSWLLYQQDQMIHGNSKTMKLHDFQLQVATSLHQIATKGRSSLTTFSRKCKYEQKQPTIYLLMYGKMVLVICQYGTTSRIVVVFVKTMNSPMQCMALFQIKRDHGIVIIMNKCKIWFRSYCTNTNIFQGDSSSDIVLRVCRHISANVMEFCL